MGTLNLICPMCCGETFNNTQSLKYHLLSLTDNLYCPSCSQRSDSVMALIQHLDMCEHDLRYRVKSDILADKFRKGGKEPEIKMDLLLDVKTQQLNRGFLATMGNNGVVIMGDSQTIQLDENGEIKVVEKMDTEETQPDQNSLDFKMPEGLVGDVGGGAQRRLQLQPSQGLMAIPISNADRKAALMEKNIIAVLPDSSELLDGETTATLIDVDRINEAEELDEVDLLRVKRELCEFESDAVYSCTSCEMSFNSVLEHIKQFHDGQEVLLEMAEQMNDLATTSPVSAMSDGSESLAGNNNARQRQTMNTLRTEECVDNEGRLYTRKVVQIERFWDRTPIQVTTTQSPKAPMIEKFFSNVEGVKVREKRLATASTAPKYKCNQCLQQFSKLGNFRVHACLRGSNRCEQCDQSFATPRALQLHAKVHDSEADPSQKTFICTTCGTEFCSHKSLRLHSRMHAPVRARHVEAPEGTPNATFTCPECGKTLSESYKDAHMTLHTGDSVTCTVCNRKFDSADSLAMHAAVHVELAPSQSPTPQVSSSTVMEATTTSATTPATVTPATIAMTSTTTVTTTATTTVSTAEPGDSQKPYQCQHCGRRFTRPHEKVKHERIHTGEKPHACEVCGKTFRVSYCLTLHMRTHTGVRPYACQHCGKRFKASSVYNHHLLTHGDERAYTCPYCPKTFKTRVQLAGHKNSHTKPFRCTECSRPFASLYAVRAHIQTHKKDNNLKFSCYVCGASYGRAFALKDHLKQHGNQDVLALPEPAREEEVHENFLLGEEEVEEDEFAAPPPPPPLPPLPPPSSLPVVAYPPGVNDTD